MVVIKPGNWENYIILSTIKLIGEEECRELQEKIFSAQSGRQIEERRSDIEVIDNYTQSN